MVEPVVNVPSRCVSSVAARQRTTCGALRAQNNLSAGMIVAGHDARDGGSVYALPLGGTRVKVPFSIGKCVASWAAPGLAVLGSVQLLMSRSRPIDARNAV